MHRSDLHARIRRRPGQALGMIGLAAQCCSVERPPAVVSHSPAESAACFQGFTRKSRRGVAAIISSAACRFPARLNDVGKRPRVCSEDAFPLFFTAGQSSLRRGRGRDTPYALRKGGRLPDDAQDAAHPRPEKARQLPRWRPESNIRPGCRGTELERETPLSGKGLQGNALRREHIQDHVRESAKAQTHKPGAFQRRQRQRHGGQEKSQPPAEPVGRARGGYG